MSAESHSAIMSMSTQRSTQAQQQIEGSTIATHRIQPLAYSSATMSEISPISSVEEFHPSSEDVRHPREPMTERAPTPSSATSLKKNGIPLIAPKRVQWNAGLLTNAPWHALASLLLSGCCIVACATILIKADGDDVTSWDVTPTVYLAILSTVSNICLTAGFGKGAIIAWWRSALAGSTVSELSEIWKYGNSAPFALLAWRRVRRFAVHRLAIVKVFMLVAFINGPLLQRALTIVPSQRRSTAPIVAHIAPQVPAGYTGFLGGRVYEYTPTSNYTAAMKAFSRQETMKSPFQNFTCTGNCTGTILAAGIDATNCTSSTSVYTWTNGSETLFQVPQLSLFASTKSIDTTGAQECLNLTVGGPVFPAGECAGEFVTTTCFLQSAVVEYAININPTDNSIEFQRSSNLSHPKIMRISNNTNDSSITPGTTLYGLVATAEERYNASMSLMLDRLYGTQFIDANLFAIQYLPGSQTGDLCSSYVNPMNDILAAFNEIMFRLSLQAAETGVNTTTHPLDESLSMTQSVAMEDIVNYNAYRIVWWAMWTAIGIMLTAGAAVLWTLWGWWEIGVEVSLGPEETAKAFVDLIATSAVPEKDAQPEKDEPRSQQRVIYGVVDNHRIMPHVDTQGQQRQPTKLTNEIAVEIRSCGERRLAFGDEDHVGHMRHGAWYLR